MQWGEEQWAGIKRTGKGAEVRRLRSRPRPFL